MKRKDAAPAKVIITIDGLAICCYNYSGKVWDVAFLRMSKHDLTLKVKDKIYKKIKKLIEIYPVSAIKQPAGTEYPPGSCNDLGPVKRRVGEDVKDKENIRWALDLDNPDDVVQDDLELRKPDCAVTRLQVKSAVFSWGGLFPKDMYRVPSGALVRFVLASGRDRFERPRLK